ncbi:DUF899 domain-containing protein [Ornithinibacillus sp. L9]|uniref:DUF899 domain-containing protein n=1 Tax=Ornithinibacillus caprae TaxID=2678566 RepID=A0A6N8FQG5_9BACI|nr:DUF899 family protein [Ornithinibacillus caprae]MUK89818.1 DUF899 domain-containing protein [Ornithinibacillus caprae]
MSQEEIINQMKELEQEILAKKQKLTELRRSIPYQKVENYQFIISMNKKVSLLDLFGDKNELIVIQNMGKSCSYCTMWADGFNGVYHHIIKKAAFVVASPDKPEVQDAFAAERRWQFPMISTIDTTFKEDFGFKRNNNYHPGVSTFTKDANGEIYHVANAPFGPGDDFCAIWHLFDLLPTGSSNFHPKRAINQTTDFQLTNNIAIQVKNYHDALTFYTKVFGMEKVDDLDSEVKLQFAGNYFYVEDNDSNNIFFEFAVSDFPQAKKLLLENGCQITKKYNEKSIMISDPYGLKFHVFESV